MRHVRAATVAGGVAAEEGWALFRGDESRNAPSDGGQPLLKVRWRQRTADDRLVERFVSYVRHDYLSQEIVALPSFHPLAVDDVVLMRTAFGHSGRRFSNRQARLAVCRIRRIV